MGGEKGVLRGGKICKGIKGEILEAGREWEDGCPGYDVGLRGSEDTCQLIILASEDNGMKGCQRLGREWEDTCRS